MVSIHILFRKLTPAIFPKITHGLTTKNFGFCLTQADSGESGTAKNGRGEFQRLIADCEAGKIDIVLTKTISRFARNTVDLLETVRRLRELGVEVRFEEQGINSMSGDGELMMTILASFAQEESRSLSENVKWAIRKGFQEGKPNSFMIYGYRWNGEKFIVVPEEAEVVRLIYANYLNNISPEMTAKQLTERGIKSYTGMDEFSASSVRAILENDKYTGTLRLQKMYVESHLTHRDVKNNGELPMYVLEDAHEAIISKETFEAVRAERKRRREVGASANVSMNSSVLTSKIKCEVCGASFTRTSHKVAKGERVRYWRCASKYHRSGKKCSVKDIPEIEILRSAAEVLGLAKFDDDVFAEKVVKITALKGYQLTFHLADGKEVSMPWSLDYQKDSPHELRISKGYRKCREWTPEQRQAASDRLKARYAENPTWNQRGREE